MNITFDEVKHQKLDVVQLNEPVKCSSKNKIKND